jgi:hypothetical protein
VSANSSSRPLEMIERSASGSTCSERRSGRGVVAGKIPEIAAARARSVPEITVFSARADHDSTTYVGGVADAIAYQPIGLIDPRC